VPQLSSSIPFFLIPLKIIYNLYVYVCLLERAQLELFFFFEVVRFHCILK
jgi:hypothetical protein